MLRIVGPWRLQEASDSRVVDEHVEPAGPEVVFQAGLVGLGAHVQSPWDGADLRRDVVGALRVDVADDDAGAFARERARDRGADAAGGASDECELLVEGAQRSSWVRRPGSGRPLGCATPVGRGDCVREPVSKAWVVGAFFVFMGMEVLLGALLAPLLGSFVSVPFRWRLEITLMAASWWLGGLLVGLLSPRVRLLEPGIGAFAAVAMTSLYAVFVPFGWFRFSLERVVLGGGIAFLLALWGADVGERVAARLGNRHSQRYLRDAGGR